MGKVSVGTIFISSPAMAQLLEISQENSSTLGKEAGRILNQALLNEGIEARLARIEKILVDAKFKKVSQTKKNKQIRPKPQKGKRIYKHKPIPSKSLENRIALAEKRYPSFMPQLIELAKQGSKLESIANELNKVGIFTVRGLKWKRHTVKDSLAICDLSIKELKNV